MTQKQKTIRARYCKHSVCCCFEMTHKRWPKMRRSSKNGWRSPFVVHFSLLFFLFDFVVLFFERILTLFRSVFWYRQLTQSQTIHAEKEKEKKIEMDTVNSETEWDGLYYGLYWKQINAVERIVSFYKTIYNGLLFVDKCNVHIVRDGMTMWAYLSNQTSK